MSRRYRKSQQRQQKANPMYAGMTVIDGMQQPRSMPRNYRSYAREGYGGNDTLYKVVNYAITNGAAIPPVLFTDKSQVGKPDGKRIDKHPLLDKLAQPNPEWTGVFFRKSIIGYFLIAGNAFQYANRVAKNGPPDELWTLPPDRVKPIPDQMRGIIGYQYDDWPAEKNPISPQLIGHLRTWNPEDPFFGMSPVQVAAVLIDQQSDARKWNLSLFQNFLKPPGAWTTTALLSHNERAKLEERINEKMAGFRNAGKVPVLDGSLKFEPSAVNPSEMDWIESTKYNAGAIANIYNMPPPLIGDTSATTYDNFEQAEIVSYTEFIFPTLDDLYDLWNMWLLPMYPDLATSGAYLYYDKESVEVVQKVIQAQKDAKATRANAGYMQGVMMLDEARALQGLPPLPGGAGQVFRLGAVLVSADKVLDYAEQSLTTPAAPPAALPEPIQLPPQQEGNDADSVHDHDTASNINSSVANGTGAADKHRRVSLHKALDLDTTEQKQAYIASVETTRKKYEAIYEKQIASYFDTEREAVTKVLNSSASTSALAGRAEGAINDQSSKLQKILLNLYEDMSVDVGGQVASSLAGEKGVIRDFLNLFGESQIKYLLLLAGTKIKQISTTTLARVRLELTDGVAQGESIPELAKRIDGLYLQQIIPNRSVTIARTEVVASSNWASVESAKQSGLMLNKVWLATEDSRTRPDHADADGQEVAMDDQFTVGGVKMDQPGDSSAPADQTVNCRCTVYFKRVQPQDTDDGTTDEKHHHRPLHGKAVQREAYRQFMSEVVLK